MARDLRRLITMLSWHFQARPEYGERQRLCNALRPRRLEKPSLS
jgi:hypothetical protein